MLQRTISTLALWLLVVLTPVLFGAPGAVWLLTLLTVLTQIEFYRLTERMNFQPQKLVGCIFGALIILSTWYLPQIEAITHIDPDNDVFTLGLIIISIAIIRRPNIKEVQSKILPTLIGILLIPFMLQFFVRLIRFYHHTQGTTTGLLLVIWLIAVAKFSDMGALLIGTGFGKNKLASEISPGKTWEGALGGVIIAAIVGAVLACVFDHFASMPGNLSERPLIAVVISIPIALMGIVSDLLESFIKRQAGVKDSGNYIPGIGGAFDLTDSLLLSAPVGFLIFKYFFF